MWSVDEISNYFSFVEHMLYKYNMTNFQEVNNVNETYSCWPRACK